MYQRGPGEIMTLERSMESLEQAFEQALDGKRWGKQTACYGTMKQALDGDQNILMH